MRSKFYLVLSLIIVMSLVLAACQQTATPVVQTVVVTVEGETETIVITATPDPNAVAEPTEAETGRPCRCRICVS